MQSLYGYSGTNKDFSTDAFNNWEIKQNFDYLKMARLHNIST